jgi:8-oxo-dGTP pyrophosphatase MutT (NUDIX family)
MIVPTSNVTGRCGSQEKCYLFGMNTWDIATLRRSIGDALRLGGRKEIDEAGYAHAAVLIPIVYRSEVPEILLTRRTDHVETHKGQISFPGGVIDQRDRSRIETALRETEEELGISPSLIETMGILDDVQTPTGFIISPVVGLLPALPPLDPSPHEVAEILFVPLEFFADRRQGRKELVNFRGTTREVWFYDYGGHTIWGATAAILRSFIQRVSFLPAEDGKARPIYPA